MMVQVVEMIWVAQEGGRGPSAIGRALPDAFRRKIYIRLDRATAGGVCKFTSRRLPRGNTRRFACVRSRNTRRKFSRGLAGRRFRSGRGDSAASRALAARAR